MKKYSVKVNGNEYTVAINNVDDKMATVSVNGTEFKVELESSILTSNVQSVTPRVVVAANNAPRVAAASAPVARPASSGSANGMKSPLPGTILDIFVKEGDVVTQGQKLLILEAMKMENNIEAETAGTVTKLAVSKGGAVMEGDLLIIIE